jgi:glycosyltransferase involved in cell wall biosynthesis
MGMVVRLGSDHLKKICFIATTPYAVNPFLKSHLLRLSKFYEVVLCVNENVYPLDDEIKRIISVHHCDIERKISVFKDIRALLQLAILFLKLRPSAIHSITPKAGLLAMIAGFMARVPYRFHTFTGQVWASKKSFSRFFLKFLDRIIAIFSTQIFTDSQSQSNFLYSEGIVKFGSARVLGPGSIVGVDIQRFKPDLTQRNIRRGDLNLANTAIVFLYVGRITKDKGLFDLIAAMNMVSGQYPDAELWIVGPDEVGIQKDLLGQVGVNVKVRWLGQTFHPEHYMVAADILLLPSYREGFGSVIIEAAACGIPAIAYKTEGVVDAIVDGQTGILVEKFNIDQFSQAMMRLIEDAAFRSQLSLAAKKRSQELFASEIITSAWEHYYLSHIK